MKLKSPEFENNGYIPKKYTCDGQNINPPLSIEDVPSGAKTLALILEDPDAPRGTWIHWVVFNIKLALKINKDSIPGIQGVNDYKKQNYGGPCPPSGTHRYIFKLFALDKELDLKAGITKQQLEKAMQGHVLAKAELTSLYKRS